LVKEDEDMVGGGMSHTYIHTYIHTYTHRWLTGQTPLNIPTKWTHLLLNITSADIGTKLSQHEDGDRTFPWNVVCKYVKTSVPIDI
jgi:hypothetical protein